MSSQIGQFTDLTNGQSGPFSEQYGLYLSNPTNITFDNLKNPLTDFSGPWGWLPS